MSRLTVQIRPICEKCNSLGICVVGLNSCIRLNPRHLLPGTYLIFIMLLGILAAYLSRVFIRSLGGTVADLQESLPIAIAVGAVYLIPYFIPLRLLICKKCRRVMDYGMGKVIPLKWLECVEPHLSCSRCGYSLIGIRDDSRCPECGQVFPSAWLVLTALGKPLGDIDVEFRVL